MDEGSREAEEEGWELETHLGRIDGWEMSVLR